MVADPSPPRLADHVLVTSAATRVDTEILVRAALQVRLLAVEVPVVLDRLDGATERCVVHAGLVPSEVAVALQSIVTAREGAVDLVRRLESLADSLAFAALVYLGAEGRAAEFREAWVALTPGSTHLWDTGIGSLHTRAAVGEALPAGLAAHVPGRAVDWLLAPTLPFLGGGVRAFLSQLLSRSGDRTTGEMTAGIRLQMDLRAASELVGDHSMALGRGVRDPGEATGDSTATSASWWGMPGGETAAAASLAASWGLGLGRWSGAPTRGVQVSTALPEDTLDMRTGRPVGVRVRHGVVHSDPSARRPSLNATPMGLGLLTAPSLVGSLTGLVPIAQGGPAREVAPAGPPARRTATPRLPSQVLARIGGLRSAEEAGQVEVLRHRTPGVEGEVTSWSVVIRGTQAWGVGGPNPQDMLSNLQVVAGEHSDQARAVLAAMEMAGVTAGQTVELVGHSQGGAVAAQLASDPEVLARYSVTSVLTAGSPTAGAAPAEGVEMLNLENTRDMVPGLDGAANRDLGAARTVHFDGGAVGGRTSDEDMSAGGPDAREEAPGAHDLRTYRRVMEWLEERGESGERGEEDVPTGYEEVRSWMQERERTLGFGEGTRTTSHVFDTRRLGVGS